jgi:hypothetical protein
LKFSRHSNYFTSNYLNSQVKVFSFPFERTSHVVEKEHLYWLLICGFNISILSGLIAGLAGRLLGPRRGALVAGIAIGAYTLLVGAAPSVVRAALMGGLSLFAHQVGCRLCYKHYSRADATREGAASANSLTLPPCSF